jgi:predicted short-subunit dehydrogenase-like oxidoreductase (DUF2520 family)
MSSLDRSSKIAFVGAGTVGGSLAVALSRGGYRVVGVASRTFSSAEGLAGRVPGCTAYESYQEAADVADVVFLTTSDDAISSVCSAVDWRPGQAVVHCSGAASLALLEHAAARGALPGAFHPLQAFSSVEGGVESIPGITFGIEGEGALRGYLRQMALDIGGNPVFLRPEDKVLYHLSGVMMGNLLTEYVALSAQLWDHLGMSREEGIRALLPMMRQVAVNLDTSGVPGAVAGPYVRGDVGTIRKHLEALSERVPELMPLYRELALAGLRYPVEKEALSRERADEIKSLLEGFGSAPGDA